MKKQCVLIGMLFACGALFSQQVPTKQMPSVIVNQFNNDFPKAKYIEWELKNNIYTVEFELSSGKDYEAWYSFSGDQIRVQEELTVSKLPKVVISSIRNNYPAHCIEDVEKITENKTVSYKIDIEHKNHEQTLLVSNSGSIIK